MNKSGETDWLGAFTFRHSLRVRWSEVDRQGIVFNPNYLLYFDVGLTEYMRAIDYSYPQELLSGGSDLFAVTSTINFRSPARYDDFIHIYFRTARIGRSSLGFEAAVAREATLLADGSIVYVNVGTELGKPSPVPDRLKERINRFEQTQPL